MRSSMLRIVEIKMANNPATAPAASLLTKGFPGTASAQTRKATVAAKSFQNGHSPKGGHTGSFSVLRLPR